MQSVEQEIRQWKEIRRTQRCIEEVHDWMAFGEGAQFVGSPLPIVIRRDTAELILSLLTDRLVRLQQSAA
jgi:hypothetical protein